MSAQSLSARSHQLPSVARFDHANADMTLQLRGGGFCDALMANVRKFLDGKGGPIATVIRSRDANVNGEQRQRNRRGINLCCLWRRWHSVVAFLGGASMFLAAMFGHQVLHPTQVLSSPLSCPRLHELPARENDKCVRPCPCPCFCVHVIPTCTAQQFGMDDYDSKDPSAAHLARLGGLFYCALGSMEYVAQEEITPKNEVAFGKAFVGYHVPMVATYFHDLLQVFISTPDPMLRSTAPTRMRALCQTRSAFAPSQRMATCWTRPRTLGPNMCSPLYLSVSETTERHRDSYTTQRGRGETQRQMVRAEKR